MIHQLYPADNTEIYAIAQYLICLHNLMCYSTNFIQKCAFRFNNFYIINTNSTSLHMQGGGAYMWTLQLTELIFETLFFPINPEFRVQVCFYHKTLLTFALFNRTVNLMTLCYTIARLCLSIEFLIFFTS